MEDIFTATCSGTGTLVKDFESCPGIHPMVLEDHVLDNHHGMIYRNHHKLETTKKIL